MEIWNALTDGLHDTDIDNDASFLSSRKRR